MLLSLLQVNIGSTKGSCQDKQVSGGWGKTMKKSRPLGKREKKIMRSGEREGTWLCLVFPRLMGLREFWPVLGSLVRGETWTPDTGLV